MEKTMESSMTLILLQCLQITGKKRRREEEKKRI
jgi:hypothetical protein